MGNGHVVLRIVSADPDHGTGTIRVTQGQPVRLRRKRVATRGNVTHNLPMNVQLPVRWTDCTPQVVSTPGGWLASSPSDFPYRIGVVAPSSREATDRFAEALDRWHRLHDAASADSLTGQ